MPNKCCVANCNKAKGFQFPKNVERRKQWMVAVKRDKWSPSPHSVVCEDHFLPTDFLDGPTSMGALIRYKRRLKPDAVPSQFFWSLPASEQDDKRKQRASKRQQKRECKTEIPSTLHQEPDVEASQATMDVPLVPNIVALAPLKLPTTSNEANLTLAFSDAERHTDHISERKKESEPVHQRLLAFRVPFNSDLYRKIRAADLRASDRAQEALQHFNIPLTAATETEREPEESAGNSTPSVDVELVKREPGECATESTPGFYGTPRTPSLCGQCTPSVCGTPSFHEVQVKFEPEECATDSTQHFQVVQVRSDFEPAESAADTDTPHFDVVQVKTEQAESATESTFRSDVVQVKLEPAESATESTSSFDEVQVKFEPEEFAIESTSSYDVLRVKTEPVESATESTSSSDVVQVKPEPEESATESTSSFDEVQVKFEPEESAMYCE